MSADLSARSVSRTEGVDRVRALQRVLFRSAKQQPGRRFHALYDKLSRRDVMWRAWSDVRSNGGAPGVDGVTIGEIDALGESGVSEWLGELAADLREGRYRPSGLRRVEIPKPGRSGESRRLGIPTVADRVVMTAAKLVLEPVFEAGFSPSSFGFRPKRSAHQALEAVRVDVNRGLVWVLDADVEDCFDSIDHDRLMEQIERRVVDRRMLKLVRGWLRRGILKGEAVSDVGAGTPQGSPVSPLLANIALHVLDEAWERQGGRLGTLVRYSDDFVVLAATRERAEAARELAAATLAGMGLRLHPEKTRIVCLRAGNEGFDFLGFHHRLVESRKWPGRWYLHKWPSRKAMASVRSRIRELTDRRYVGVDLSVVIARINRTLRGWGGYFRYGNSTRQFAAVDQYVHQRVARLASAKHGLSGRNWTSRFSYQWLTRQDIHRLTGTVTYWAAAHA